MTKYKEIQLLSDIDGDQMDWSINTKSVNNKMSITDIKRRNMTEHLENMLDYGEQLSRAVFLELNSSKNFELYKGLIRVDTRDKLYDLLHFSINYLGVNANYNWIDTSLITNMSNMGFGTYFNGHIELWDVSNVTDMSYMFCNAASFNRNIGNWDVSKVTDMEQMFALAETFNQPIGNWNVSNVKTMKEMFLRASEFNQPINKWDVSNVVDMAYMFYNARKFNKPLNKWKIGKKTVIGMFKGAHAFNQPLNNWDMSQVTSLYSMFEDAKSFNQPLNDWDVSNVKYFGYMFNCAESFNQPLDKWNINSLISYSGMFLRAYSFKQDLSSWKLNAAVDLEAFEGCPLEQHSELLPRKITKGKLNLDDIPLDAGLDVDVELYKGKIWDSFVYIGNCIDTVPDMWDATEMAQFLLTCDVYDIRKAVNKLRDSRRVPNKLKKALLNNNLNDLSEICCGCNEASQLMFIYVTDQDIHYFFECK